LAATAANGIEAKLLPPFFSLLPDARVAMCTETN
jgi:hypothetical protein